MIHSIFLHFSNMPGSKKKNCKLRFNNKLQLQSIKIKCIHTQIQNSWMLQVFFPSLHFCNFYEISEEWEKKNYFVDRSIISSLNEFNSMFKKKSEMCYTRADMEHLKCVSYNGKYCMSENSFPIHFFPLYFSLPLELYVCI